LCIFIMHRSKSVPTVVEDKRVIRRNDSVPKNMHSDIEGRRWQSLDDHNIKVEGFCVIKNSHACRKEMQVKMEATNGLLDISFMQQNNAIFHEFTLVSLTIKNLAIFYSARQDNSFYLGCGCHDDLDLCIYCTFPESSTKSWLLAFQKMGARMEILVNAPQTILSPVRENTE